MRTLIVLAITGLALAQTPAPKPAEKAPELPKDKVIEFLKAQRDIQGIQMKYDQAFKAEPAVVAFSAKLAELQKLCGTATLNASAVTCELPPPPAKETPKK